MKTYPHTLTAEEVRRMAGDGALMLEIGSHDGTDTAKFLAAMPHASLHCFEPDPRPRERFWENVAHSTHVTLCPMAVTDSDQPKQFYASTGQVNEHPDWDYSGSLRQPIGHLKYSPEIGFKDPVPVPCIRLDSWLEEEVVENGLQPIDFIWADVQGGQRGLIAGGRCALAMTRWLYIECHHEALYDGEPSPAQLIELLSGFEPMAIYSLDNILFRNRHFQ